MTCPGICAYSACTWLPKKLHLKDQRLELKGKQNFNIQMISFKVHPISQKSNIEA